MRNPRTKWWIFHSPYLITKLVLKSGGGGAGAKHHHTHSQSSGTHSRANMKIGHNGAPSEGTCKKICKVCKVIFHAEFGLDMVDSWASSGGAVERHHSTSQSIQHLKGRMLHQRLAEGVNPFGAQAIVTSGIPRISTDHATRYPTELRIVLKSKCFRFLGAPSPRTATWWFPKPCPKKWSVRGWAKHLP